MAAMRISQLAQVTGTTVHALRHYEKCGLLQPVRSANGWREYPPSARREVVFISMSRAIGFSLREIGEWLPAYRTGRLTLAQLDEVMQNRLAELDRQIAELQRQRQAVADHRVWIGQRQTRQGARAAAPAAPATGAKPWPSTRRRGAAPTPSSSHLPGKP